jgi:ribonucleoside-diphosphate reductase alpha chain
MAASSSSTRKAEAAGPTKGARGPRPSGASPAKGRGRPRDGASSRAERRGVRPEGLVIERWWTTAGVDPFDEVEWELRTAAITGERGEVIFEQRDLEIPRFWSQLATNVVASKYFRGPLGDPSREHSVRQLIGRVVRTIAGWGRQGGYFATEADADAFQDELTHLMLHQKASFNSPVWFNIGVEGAKPQGSACFINSVDDNMESIMRLAATEARLFKGGSGTGSNLSTIRSSREPLAGGGIASGPVSFMRGYDSFAGAIKSGGKCFRAGTLVATPDGWRPIETLSIGELVLTHKGPRAVADFMPNGLKQCCRVRTREGYEVEVTRGHKFAYWRALEGGFDVKPIEEFAPGEALYILLEPSEGGISIPLAIPESHDPSHATTTVEMKLPTELNDELAYVVGLMYGDAEVRREYPYRVRVAFAKDPAGRASADRFREYCVRLFGEEPLLLGDEPGHQQIGFTRKRLVEFLVANGLDKGRAKTLGFPKVLFQARPEVRAAFIAGVIDADGTYQRRGGWSISSIDREFLVEFQRLLLTLGVPAKIKLNREQQGTWQPLYRLCIVGHTFIERLVQRVAPYSTKASLNYEPSGGADKGWGYRPSLYASLAARVELRGGYRLVERRVGINATTGYGALATVATHPEAAVAEYAGELCHCVQVILETVEATEVAETYDIEVDDVHLLSANGFYASNTRRAAKMVILDVDHPDIVDFIRCKAEEEKKAWSLIEAGYNGGFNVPGGAYDSIFFQNANHSVRVSDEFMHAVESKGEWHTRFVLTREPADTYKARDLLQMIADATHICGDPGMQFDTTINRWHTCKNTDRIYASNPCSEYMFLNDSACNLASINLLRFRRDDGEFDPEAFGHACEVIITAQEILVDNASYPTEKIAQNSYDYRPLGLGYANLGALLMARGIPYDSDTGRAMAGAITALMTGAAYRQSARIASFLGPFAGFERNREPMLEVIGLHRSYVDRIDASHVTPELLEAARGSWDDALKLGRAHGFRNSQATVLAPTGTIAFMMDCDTTGIEPDIALVKYKTLVGGGVMKIVNQTVPEALRRLGYRAKEVSAIIDYIDANGTIEGAPHLQEEDLPVFDCAFRAANGTRSIHYLGHLRMMAAAQPFLSGAISKTCNVPEDITVEEIEEVYLEAWKQGLKAVAIYRDGSKRTQPLSTAPGDSARPATETRPLRRKLPDERRSFTHKFSIAGHEGYVTVGMYEDGSPGEIFIVMSKEGSVVSGLMDSFATAISLALQYGVPLRVLVNKFSHTRFEPSGWTNNKDIPIAKSVMDYIFRWLALKFLPQDEQPATPDSLSNGQAASALPANGYGGEAAPASAYLLQEDAPPCSDCGAIMVRNGACYRCLNCGSTSGCS